MRICKCSLLVGVLKIKAGIAVLSVLCTLSPMAAVAATCSDPPTEPALVALCGISAPEDLVRLGQRYLIVSSMAPGEDLFVVDTSDDRLLALTTELVAPERSPRWGDPNCPPPRELLAHGLDLARGEGGRRRLLVVNHGERESIEFFEVTAASGQPALRWRGCVRAPEDVAFNDVAILPDGGFLATNPTGLHWPRLRAILALLQFHTGNVYRWRPSSGFEVVPHTQGPYPNGIVVAPDRESFYLNMYFAGEVRHHDLDSGELIAKVEVEKPDNSNWSDDGQLLVASHRGSIPSIFQAISNPPAQRNRIPWAIVAVDVDQMSARDIYLSDGEALGGGTAVQRLGRSYYIGAFRGDRLLRVTLP